jgi:putative tryptophan/tyrosine transport system substrate-binding protein
VQFAATEAAAKALGLEAEILEVRSPDDVEGATETARARQADGGILLSSPVVYGHVKEIAELALAKRLPFICLFPIFSKLGGLMSYGPDMEDEWRRCAGYVGRILHGEKPSDLPIQRPEKFDLVINPQDRRSPRNFRAARPTRHRERGDRINAAMSLIGP